MAWTTFPTLTDGQIWTGAHTQIVRDNFAETAPAKATASGQFFVSTAANALAARTPVVGAVATGESINSASYVDLATTGPQATVTSGTSALVFISSRLSNATATAVSYASFQVTGATPTVSADDRFAIEFQPESANRTMRATSALLVTGLTAGSNTFAMRYRTSAGNGTWTFRQISVLPF